jgi:hypothetical protein
MREPRPFDPIEVGEIDNVYFDFTGDVGAATILSATWTCSMAPYQQPLIDPTPQARVLQVQWVNSSVDASASRTSNSVLEVRSPIDGALSAKVGNFVIAQIGTYPASFAGGTYLHEATATLDDKRVLKRSATMLCAPSP